MTPKTSLALLAAGMLLAGAVGAMPLGPHFKPKWSQPLDPLGIDILSMHRSNGPVIADDFQSDGRPIAGFHWWGSYLTDPATGQEWGTGQGADRQLSFESSLHQNCPAGTLGCNNGNGGNPYNFDTPSNNPPYFSAIVSATEQFVGNFNGSNVYEYWLDLTGIPGPDFLAGTWNEVAGDIYWVDFAWNAGQFGTAFDGDVWGWHTSATQNLGSAVQTIAPISGGNPHTGSWNPLGTDMAFEVLTVPEPASLALLALGAAGMGYRLRRRRHGRA